MLCVKMDCRITFSQKKGAPMTFTEVYQKLELNSLADIEIFFEILKISLVVFVIDSLSYMIFKTTLTTQIRGIYHNLKTKALKAWDSKVVKSTNAMLRKIELEEDSAISEGLSLQVSKGIDYDDIARIIEEKITLLQNDKKEEKIKA